MQIRRATTSDAAALARFAARTFAETFADANTPQDMEAHLRLAYGVAQQTRELADPDTLTLLAEQDGRLAGYAQVRRNAPPAGVDAPDAFELHRFYVDQAWQGRGVARQLMDAVHGAARAAGAGRLWLGVWEHNPRAIRFYAKCGFVDVGSQVFVLGTDRQTDRIMLAPVPHAQGPG